MDGILIMNNLAYLHSDDEIIEIRSIDPKPTISGYFKSGSPNIVSEMARFPDRTFYQTLNVIDPACYSRGQREKLCAYPKETTSDKDIIGYSHILIDLDPVRATGVSATDEEKEKAHQLAIEVFSHLRKLGFADPIVADSGNGYHLIYKIKAELNSKDAIENFLKVLDMWFSNEFVKIDTAVFNPSRITKAYGTVARKGANSPERPHRLSRILHVPEELKLTPMPLVKGVAAERSKLVKPAPEGNRRGYAAFDIDAFLAEHHVEVTRKVDTSDGTKYILAECPFDPSHKYPDAAVFCGKDGALGFHCFHNHCSDYHWHDFRAKVDPQAYVNSVFRSNQMAETPLNIANTISSTVSESDYQSIDFPDDASKAATHKAAKAPVMLDIAEVEDYDRSKIVTIRSRFQKMDALIGGFNKGEVSIWSGANSSGKSTLVSQLGLEAVHQGYKVAMFSGEMPPKLVKYWLYLQAAGRDHVEADPLSPNHYRLQKGVKEYLNKILAGSIAVYNNDYGNNWETVAGEIFKWVQEKGSDVVIIDNLMALNITGTAQDKYDTQTQIVQFLSRVAKQLNVHIHFICHPRKTDSFLRKNDISGTSDLTNTADNVFMVHRINNDFLLRIKEVYPKLTIPGDAGNAIEIMKNRDLGVVDEMILLFFDRTCKTLSDVRGGVPGFGWLESMTEIQGNDSADDWIKRCTPIDPKDIDDFPF